MSDYQQRNIMISRLRIIQKTFRLCWYFCNLHHLL